MMIDDSGCQARHDAMQVIDLSSTYTYRVLRSSWGILISITADALTDEVGDGAVPVGRNVFLLDATQGPGLSDEVMGMLARGLAALSAEVTSAGSGESVTVAVRDIRYNDCDFQAEGLAAAMFGWAVAAFNLPEREVAVAFDRGTNRYLFDLPGPYRG